MDRTDQEKQAIRDQLMSEKDELKKRVDRIHDHARDPLEQDSAEQAAQLGNVAVVSALEAEAVGEIAEIDAALQRLDAGNYGICITCGEPISEPRLKARPASAQCVDCAELS